MTSNNNEILADALEFCHDIVNDLKHPSVTRLLDAASADLTEDYVEPHTAAHVARLIKSDMPLSDLTYRRAGELIVRALGEVSA